MMELKTISIVIIFALTFAGCYYDVEEEIYPTIDCLTADMSYTDDILPIIKVNCYVCHSTAANFGNITLEGYDKLKKHADNGALIGAIKHQSGYSPMPKNQAQLLICEIEKIEAWITQGALNN